MDAQSTPKKGANYKTPSKYLITPLKIEDEEMSLSSPPARKIILGEAEGDEEIEYALDTALIEKLTPKISIFSLPGEESKHSFKVRLHPN